MKKYTFKPMSKSESVIRETFEDGTSMDLYIEIRENTVVVSTMHGTLYWSSPVINFRGIDIYGGDVLFMMIMAGLGHFGVSFSANVHGALPDHIQEWARIAQKTPVKV